MRRSHIQAFPPGTAKGTDGYRSSQANGSGAIIQGRYLAAPSAQQKEPACSRFGSRAHEFRAMRRSACVAAHRRLLQTRSLFEAIQSMTDVKRRRRRTAPAGIAPNEPERDILDQYLYEVSTYPLLKGDEEIVLARKIRAGDQESLQELVKRNLRFVISVAKKYQNRGLPLIDLIGEGNVGLLTAARKFDPDQGVKFISYAVWWIRQAILSSLARQGRTVRVPLNRTA